MSICTLDAILDPRLIPDVSVICRGCLEFDVTLEAVIKDADAARDYLDFAKHAKARYLKILSAQGDINRFLKLRDQFKETFSEDPEDLGRRSWCAKQGGVTGLMRTLGRTTDVRLYNMLSHFAHGSIWAMQTLDGNISDPEIALATLVEGTYTGYLDSSREFIWLIWEPLTTPEGERCKNDFIQVMSAHVTDTT
jgi:hypothetical protein